jgi:hypothetical protein
MAEDQVDASGFPVPGTGPEPGTGLYVDVARLLEGGIPDPPAPTVLRADDGVGTFYPGQVNLVFGDAESGKTWLCLAAVAEVLAAGGSAAVLDLDHNGPDATVTRLLDLGAPEDALIDRDRFRYAEPDGAGDLLAIVGGLSGWMRPTVVVVDSVGELLPQFGASSNSPDDFTGVHSRVLKPLAKAGSCVLAIDHLAKSPESRAMGSTGTAAKKRAVGGVSIRVTTADQFTPGRGGSAHLAIAKDRHGGLRKRRPAGDKEPLAGTFVLGADGTWSLTGAKGTDRNPAEAASAGLVAQLLALEVLPRTGDEARALLKCRKSEALKALKDARRQAGSRFPTPVYGTGNRAESDDDKAEPDPTNGPVPGSVPLYREPGTEESGPPQRCRVCGERLPASVTAGGWTTHPTCDDGGAS